MADKRPWFKHFSNAHQGCSISELLSKKEHQAIACYWVLIELISIRGRDGVLEISRSEMRRILNLHPHQLDRVLGLLLTKSMVECSPSGGGSDTEVTLQVKAPKFLECQSSWGGKRGTKMPMKIEEEKIEDRTPIVPAGDVCVGSDPKPNQETFARVYDAYPRKIGRTRGLARLAKVPARDLPLLERAVANYAQHCKAHGTEQKFIKHFSSWVTEWRDWIDPPDRAKRDPTGIDALMAGFRGEE